MTYYAEHRSERLEYAATKWRGMTADQREQRRAYTRARARAAYVPTLCRDCGAPKGKGRVYCIACRPTPDTTVTTLACAHCGGAFEGRRGRRFCTPRCGRRTHKGAHEYRARMASAPVREQVLRRVVFERDRWSCHICGARTERQGGVLRRWSPTLDHVVPISAGGEHSYSNVRTAHMVCNSRKGGRRNFKGRTPHNPQTADRERYSPDSRSPE